MCPPPLEGRHNCMLNYSYDIVRDAITLHNIDIHFMIISVGKAVKKINFVKRTLCKHN